MIRYGMFMTIPSLILVKAAGEQLFGLSVEMMELKRCFLQVVACLHIVSS